MQSDQHSSAPSAFPPQDLLLAADVDVGWRVGLKAIPGQVPPPDGYPLAGDEDVTAVFEAEYLALLRDPASVAEVREAIVQAVLRRMNEVRAEFFVQEFAYSLFRIVVCWDCVSKIDCPKCNKTGFVTEVFTPYLVGYCSIKAVHHARDHQSLSPSPEPPPPLRQRPHRRWLLLTVPIAALATVLMAASIGLRFMLQSGEPSRPTPAFPQPGVHQAAPSLPVPPDLPSAPALEPRVEADAPPSPPPIALDPPGLDDDSPAPPVEPRRKPVSPEPPIATTAPPPPAPPPAGGDRASPVGRLQTALTQLGFYHGPVTGTLDETTRHALSEFLALVPPPVRAHYGARTAALAEAAARQEFALKGR